MTLHSAGEQTATHLCEIEDVQPARTDPALLRAEVEGPVPGTRRDTWALPVTGWAIGTAAPARAVHVGRDDAAWSLPVHDRRPDVAARHPDREWARHAGFSGTVNLLRLAPRFELDVTAELADGTRTPLARIAGRRAPLRSPYEPELRPLMVTTLGRTGSTWLIHLLAGHPQVAAYRPFSFEPRAATYWVDVVTGLAEPSSYMQQLEGEVSYPGPWWLGSGTRMTSETLPDAELARWLGSEHVADLAAFAQQRIDALYGRVAAAAGERPRYFAEKFLPRSNVPQLLRELYPDACELVLVRDFRDMLCSIRSFNEQRGRPAFGLEAATDLEHYVADVLAPSVAGLLDEWRARRGAAHLVRYVDLLADPAPTVGGILRHAGLASSADHVEALLARAAGPVAGMEDHRTTRHPRESIGRWRTELDPALRSLCDEAFGEALAEFGYETAATGSVAR